MVNVISSYMISQISEFIASRMGLHFPENRWPDLERGVASAAKEFGFSSPEEFAHQVMSSTLTKKHIEALASHLTVGETYFFREKEAFNILEEKILPELIRSRENRGKYLRIWSAGCCTGEEAYSIAILLSRMIPDIKDWNITILATDINANFLKKAAEGVYSEWSFRSTPQWIKDKYFTKKDDKHYKISSPIKQMVRFAYLNLAEDVYPSLVNNTNAMDMIFCRNVLMYFSDEKAGSVVQGFHKSLVNNGWLLVSPSEMLRSLTSLFNLVNFGDAIIYRRVTDKPHDMVDIYCPPAQPELRHEAVLEPLRTEQDFVTDVAIPKPAPLREPSEPIRHVPEPDIYEDALCLFKKGKYAGVIEKLDEHAAGVIANPKVIALKARAYANQGMLDKASDLCKKAVEADALRPEHHYLLATILLEKGLTEEAVKSLKSALYLDHDFVLAYFMLGSIMLRQGRKKESSKYLKNAYNLLAQYKDEDELPESEGITAGRLAEIISSMNG